jgi:hypothetical protein
LVCLFKNKEIQKKIWLSPQWQRAI